MTSIKEDADNLFKELLKRPDVKTQETKAAAPRSRSTSEELAAERGQHVPHKKSHRLGSQLQVGFSPTLHARDVRGGTTHVWVLGAQFAPALFLSHQSAKYLLALLLTQAF